MRFQTTVELGGKTATGLRVPPEVLEALGAGKKPAVTVTVGAHTYRSTIATMGGAFFIPLSAENRTAAGVAAGDAVEVQVELDTAPRVLEVAADFAAALDAEPAAKAAFDKLSYSHKRRWTLSIDDAKTPETRQRRIDKAVIALREGKGA
jgi:antitoxin component of MazEF toxin-antitoxin module